VNRSPNVPLKTYGLSIASVAAAVVLRLLLDPILGDTLPLVTLFGAVALAVWIGGYGPAIVATWVGYLACSFLFIPPRGYLDLSDATNVVGLTAYLFTCSLIIGLGEAARRAQRRAQERGELLRVTLQSIGDAVITTDTLGRVTSMNKIAESLTAWSQSLALGRPLEEVFRIINEETRAPVASPAERTLREGVIVGLANHTVLIDKSGAERPIDDSAAPIRDETGRVSGCILIFRDVTHQRQLERENARQLHAARLLASIVESSDDAIISKSLDGVIQSWNAAAERLFGHRAEEAIGRHISLIIPEDRLFEEDRIIASIAAGQRIDHFETERMHRDGKRLAVSLTVSPVKDHSGAVVGASKIARDITVRKLIEAERQKFVTLVENSTDFIGMCDLDGIPFFVNRAGLQMTGLDGIEHARRVQMIDFFFPEDQARIMEEFFPTVLEKGHGEVEVRFRHFKTGAALWMAYKLVTLTDDAGRPIGFATVSQDVTERRRFAEDLRKLAADLSEADRRKNEFLAMLAHELRNPLAPIASMIEVLKRSEGDANTLRRARETIERQVRQLVRLVDDLLELNRITHNRLELRWIEVDLATVIQNALESSRPLAEAARHTVKVDLPQEPIRLRADPARLAQVFGNLLNNACKYTPPEGTIWVMAERSGHYVDVSVRDTGIGIAPDKLDDIFEMFTQLRPAVASSQSGLGIGLTLVKRLVGMHGGSIQARSGGEGQGSEFVVRLPVIDVAEAATQARR
jgi:PAS domain S-box-containing protein